MLNLFEAVSWLLLSVSSAKPQIDPFQIKNRLLPYEWPKQTSSCQYETDYGDGSCNVRHFTCLTSKVDNLISSQTLVSPYDCCKSCLNNSNCKSWAHYYINQTATSYLIGKFPVCQFYSQDYTGYPTTSKYVTPGNCAIGSRYDETKSGQRPNYVVYFPDTIRKESMSTYGHTLPVTPYIDKFVSNGNGVVFENHISQHSQCSPSRNIMLTGRYMHVLGHRTQKHLIRGYEPNYLRWMRDSGYYILWLGKNDAFSVESFPQSVNEWYDYIGISKGGNKFPFGEAGYYSFYSKNSSVLANSTSNLDRKAVIKALDWIKNDRVEPFIIFIDGIGAHPSYSAPVEYYNKFTQEQVHNLGSNLTLREPYPSKKPDHLSKNKGIPYWRNLTNFNKTFFEEINAIYLGMVSYMDYNFGTLYQGIDSMTDEKSVTNNTIIFMSTDHGDFGGDYNCVEKYPGALDDVLINIPLVARVPQHMRKYTNSTGEYSNGVRIRGGTESLDIFKTMASLGNVDIEFNTMGRDLTKSLIYGKEIDLDRVVYSEAGFYWHNELYPNGTDEVPDKKNMHWPRALEEMSNNGTGSPKCVSMQDLNYKLVFRPRGVSEFYDLKNDPRQINNLWNNETYSKIQFKYFYNLTSWLVTLGDTTPILYDSRGLPADDLPTLE